MLMPDLPSTISHPNLRPWFTTEGDLNNATVCLCVALSMWSLRMSILRDCEAGRFFHTDRSQRYSARSPSPCSPWSTHGLTQTSQFHHVKSESFLSRLVLGSIAVQYSYYLKVSNQHDPALAPVRLRSCEFAWQNR
jgi:hypothetical protein